MPRDRLRERELNQSNDMFVAMVFAILGANGCAATAPQPSTVIVGSDACIGDRDETLAFDIEQFDRTPGSGWRPIAEVEGCEIAAADLIAEYRETRISPDDPRSESSLAWHEGQLRATAGQTDRALNLFSRTYRENIEHNADVSWNLYVAATIAFLKQDRAALDAAHEELRTLPEPDFWAAAVERTQEKYGFTPVWPSNLNVVEKFQHCFSSSYKEAYSGCESTQSERSE